MPRAEAFVINGTFLCRSSNEKENWERKECCCRLGEKGWREPGVVYSIRLAKVSFLVFLK